MPGNKQSINSVCRDLAEAGNKPAQEGALLVIAFDLPNHGARTTNERRNDSWGEGNVDHGEDMWGCM